MALQHLRSGVASKRPIPTIMSEGQLALNTNEASPGLFFKDSNGDLIKIGPVHIGTDAPNSSPASTAATALVTGATYQILTVGTSDFTLVGASANTVGTIFTATGTTTGDGTVSGQQGVGKGEQWLDTTGGNYVLKIYDGTAWRSESGEFVSVSGDTMTGALLLDNAASVSAPDLSFDGDADTGIYSPGADEFGIVTGGTAAINIDSSGNVGIGATAQTVRLELNDSSATDGVVFGVSNTTTGCIAQFSQPGVANWRFGQPAGTDAFAFYGFGSGTYPELMRIGSTGQTGLLFSSTYGHVSYSSQASSSSVYTFWSGHSSTDTLGTGGTNTFRVASNGDVKNVTGTIGTISDAKLKENIVDAESQWEDLKAVRFRKYNFKEETGYDTHTQLGVIAHELEEVCPGLVEDIPDIDMEGNDLGTTTKNVKTSILTLKALVALQEAMGRIETLEASNADLLARVEALERA